MPISSVLGSSALLPAGLGFRNKIINGDMRIAQRGTSAVVAASQNQYPVDRWTANSNATNSITVQQVADAPAGFTYSVRATSGGTGAAYSASHYTFFTQKIEGFNIADLAWGTASAKPITISFWVKTSANAVGTHAIAVENSAGTMNYVATYTVSSTNWEYKTIQIQGPTSGTFTVDNSLGINLNFTLGAGANYETTAGVWTSGKYATSATVDLGALASATWQITGVQLEQNYQATPFEQRPYGTELALCQRYFHIVPAGDLWAYNLYWNVGLSGGGQAINYRWPAPMRTIPTIRTSSGSATALDFSYYQNQAGAGIQKFLEDTGSSSVYGCKTLLYSSNNNGSTLLAANGYTMGQCQIPLWVNAEL